MCLFFKVVVTHPNKEPAESVPVKLSATGIQGNEKKDLKPTSNSNSEDKTNKDGEAEFRVDSCAECQTITMKVWENTLFTSLALAYFYRMVPFRCDAWKVFFERTAPEKGRINLPKVLRFVHVLVQFVIPSAIKHAI